MVVFFACQNAATGGKIPRLVANTIVFGGPHVQEVLKAGAGSDCGELRVGACKKQHAMIEAARPWEGCFGMGFPVAKIPVHLKMYTTDLELKWQKTTHFVHHISI